MNSVTGVTGVAGGASIQALLDTVDGGRRLFRFPILATV